MIDSEMRKQLERLVELENKYQRPLPTSLNLSEYSERQRLLHLCAPLAAALALKLDGELEQELNDRVGLEEERETAIGRLRQAKEDLADCRRKTLLEAAEKIQVADLWESHHTDALDDIVAELRRMAEEAP